MSGAGFPRRAFSNLVRRASIALSRRGRLYVQLDAQGLLAAARKQTGLVDFGETGFLDPFHRLLASYEADARLTLLGRIGARQDTIRLLATRLLLEEDRRKFPEIAAQSIRRPLFVTGLPRTGTTLLHGLLAQDPAARAPLNWEMLYPSPAVAGGNHQSDQRIAMAERQIRWFYRLAPDFRRIHPIGARLPEECLILTSYSFMSFQFQTSHPVHSYQKWLEAQDLQPSYRKHRELLQHLQWNTLPRQWILKAPAHLFGLEAIFAVYPDAEVVVTHRDPTEVVASMASLHTALRSTFCEGVDPKQVGDEVCRRWADGVGRMMRVRDSGVVPAQHFVDIRYEDIVQHPIDVVRRIYSNFDRELTPPAETRMRRFLELHPKDRFGRHEYSLEQFGLDRGRVCAEYASYRERFNL